MQCAHISLFSHSNLMTLDVSRRMDSVSNGSACNTHIDVYIFIVHLIKDFRSICTSQLFLAYRSNIIIIIKRLLKRLPKCNNINTTKISHKIFNFAVCSVGIKLFICHAHEWYFNISSIYQIYYKQFFSIVKYWPEKFVCLKWYFTQLCNI